MIVLLLKRHFAIPPLLSLLLLASLKSTASADDTLAKELESKMAKLLEDHEFGLPTYASEALLEIESSPDSLHWFQGKAKFIYFVAGQIEFRKADWDLNPITGSRGTLIHKETGTQLVPSLFDFKSCARSMMKYHGTIYDLERFDFEGSPEARWKVIENELAQSSCVAIEPLNWPFIYTTAFSRGMDQGRSMLRFFFEHNLCAKASQIDARTVQSVWFSKVTTPEGHRLMYQNITFKDGLPSVIESLSYQAGFRDIKELPDRKKCAFIHKVETTWTQVDDVPVPAKVVALLSNAGFKEVQELNLTVNLKFWNEGTKEYQAMKTLADQAAGQIDKIDAAKVSK